MVTSFSAPVESLESQKMIISDFCEDSLLEL